MRILVCGGRDYTDYIAVATILNSYRTAIDPKPTIITGMARGIDTLAWKFAKNWGCPTDEYPANWAKNGKAAGSIRNKQMLDEGKPDLVIAFPGGRGTAHMVKIAKEAGVEVREIT